MKGGLVQVTAGPSWCHAVLSRARGVDRSWEVLEWEKEPLSAAEQHEGQTSNGIKELARSRRILAFLKKTNAREQELGEIKQES